MEALLVDKFLDFALGGLGALVGLAWLMLRLYIRDQIHDLKDFLTTKYDEKLADYSTRITVLEKRKIR